MAKSIKRTVGKQVVREFFCPVCQAMTGEQQVGKDITCEKNETKVVQLCYRCGYTKTEKVRL